VQGVRKTVSGMLKLLFPDGSYTKEDVEQVLVYALKLRRRVKEQLKKLGGMSFTTFTSATSTTRAWKNTSCPCPNRAAAN
jgi:predicted ATP-dependent Lon-type protease